MLKRATRTIGALLLAGIAAACGSEVRRPLPAERAVPQAALQWPRSSQQPLIRFIGPVARPADLGIQPSFWQRVAGVVGGDEAERFVRPAGVSVLGSTLFVADPGAQTLWILDPEAGRFQQVRHAKGEPLISPVAVTSGSANRIYVADSYLAKVLVYDANGEPEQTIAGENLRRPAGLAYDETSDRLYVADSAAHCVWVFSGDGRALGSIGQRGVGEGEFNFPTHLAVDREGTLHVTDALGFRIQTFGRNGRFLGSFGRHGDGSGDFAAPKGVAVDSEGHVYVVDALFDTVQIFDRGGRYLMGFGQRGVGPGQFWLPSGLYIDANDRVYVADSYNQRIQVFQYLAGGGDG